MHNVEKGKDIIDDCHKANVKSRSGKVKPFAIEHRVRPEKRTHFAASWFSVWHVCKRYETAERRDAALEQLNRKDKLFEYRGAE